MLQDPRYSLGLDIEVIGRVTKDLWDFVFTESEKMYLSGLSENEKLFKSTALFSIKEAFYKFQRPITKVFLDFLEVEVSLPDLKHVNVISDTVCPTSEIRDNNVALFIENQCILALVF